MSVAFHTLGCVIVYNGLMFREEIRKHSERVAEFLEAHPHIAKVEERTKGSLIEPLLRCLGYIPNDPGHVMREAATDSGKKKVDYMLTGAVGAKVAVEAKSASTTLSVSDIQQLQDYFTYSEAVAAILTNGVDFWLFTDLDKSNVMDTEPYRKIDILSLTEDDLRHLESFARSNVTQLTVHEKARWERLGVLIARIVTQELNDPSTEFLRMVGKRARISPITKPKLEWLKPLVTDAIRRSKGGYPPPPPPPQPPPPPPNGLFSLFGEPLDAKTHAEMLTSVVNQLLERHADRFDEVVADSSTFLGRKYWMISKDENALSPTGQRFKVGQHWVDKNLSKKDKIKRAHLFLTAFGHQPGDLVIHTKDDSPPA